MRFDLVFVLVAAACGRPSDPVTPLSNSNHDKAPVGPHEPLATIQRTACLGWCPVYKVTIFRDGAVEYDGERFVKTKDHATGRISSEQLMQLGELFQNNHYLVLKDSYEDYSMTDMPSVYTSYSPVAHETKTIKHYLGDQSAPKALVEVEEGIDRIVQIEQWIGTNDERMKSPEKQRWVRCRRRSYHRSPTVSRCP